MGRHGTIAGRKSAQDSRRAATFTKYARVISVAAKAGGDPDYNPSLRTAIEKAKAAGLPNDNIKRAIMKGTGELGGDAYEEGTYEGYGPGGVAIVVDFLTDNKNRTSASVKHSFDKFGGNLGTPGCVSYMFDKKGVFVFEKNEDSTITEDELMEAAIEAGAEDVVNEEDCFTVYCDPSDFNAVGEALKAAGYNADDSDIERVPSVMATPDDSQISTLRKLIDALEDDEDVQKVEHNCAVDLYPDEQ